MKTDSELKKDVERELEWDPAVNAAGVGVEVHDRVVTLSGHLGSYAEKITARKAAQRVAGVKGLVIELDVRVASPDRRSDEDIATLVRSVLEGTAGLSEKAVKVSVEKGQVTLSGEVDWGYQMRMAENLVMPLRGVTTVINQINIKPVVTTGDVAGKISAALKRHAEHEAKHIDIAVEDGTVTLSGAVDSLLEKLLVCNVAWSAPGVRAVVDRLSVGA